MISMQVSKQEKAAIEMLRHRVFKWHQYTYEVCNWYKHHYDCSCIDCINNDEVSGYCCCPSCIVLSVNTISLHSLLTSYVDYTTEYNTIREKSTEVIELLFKDLPKLINEYDRNQLLMRFVSETVLLCDEHFTVTYPALCNIVQEVLGEEKYELYPASENVFTICKIALNHVLGDRADEFYNELKSQCEDGNDVLEVINSGILKMNLSKDYDKTCNEIRIAVVRAYYGGIQCDIPQSVQDYLKTESDPESDLSCLEINTESVVVEPVEPLIVSAKPGLNSYAQGVLGEQQVYKMLCDSLPLQYSTELKASKKNSADIWVTSPHSTVLVDIKNYTTKVPQSEIDKLENDLWTNANADAGMLISLNSGVVGCSDKFTMTKLRGTADGTKPILVVQCNDPTLIAIACEFISTVAIEIRSARGGLQTGELPLTSAFKGLCEVALTKMLRISTISKSANDIQKSACDIMAQATILYADLRTIFGEAGFSRGNPHFDFDGAKYPKRYVAKLTALCAVSEPVSVGKNKWKFGPSVGFVKITTTSVTRSMSVELPAKEWIDILE